MQGSVHAIPAGCWLLVCQLTCTPARCCLAPACSRAWDAGADPSCSNTPSPSVVTPCVLTAGTSRHDRNSGRGAGGWGYMPHLPGGLPRPAARAVWPRFLRTLCGGVVDAAADLPHVPRRGGPRQPQVPALVRRQHPPGARALLTVRPSALAGWTPLACLTSEPLLRSCLPLHLCRLLVCSLMPDDVRQCDRENGVEAC